LGATIITNKRRIASDEFFRGLFETALEADEIITKVQFPKPQKAAYVKFPNPASRYALVGVFVCKRGSEIRVAVTGAGNGGVFLALKMGRPLFLEGEAGVGKTEIAKVLCTTLGRRLIRLQCYEGLDVAAAVYEWNYAAQMIAIRVAEAQGEHDRDRLEHDVFSERFLIKRPLLQALEPDTAGAPVLLIDELDRADEAFEAFLLEVLADFQVTIPELGTVKAPQPPVVLITSNRTREIHDALKRRCLYHWVGYPNADRELAIVRAKAPGVAERLSREIVHFVQALRRQDLFKAPGVAETLDWATALSELDTVALDPAT